MFTLMISFIAFLAFAPAIFWVKIIARRQPLGYNKNLTRKLFLLSMATFLPIIIVECVVSGLNPFTADSYLGVMMENFIFVALVEEIFKWILLVCFTSNNNSERDKYDYIAWSVAASLGFALVENALYVFCSDNPIFTGISRLFLSVPSHLCYGIVMGYFFGSYINCKNSCQTMKALLCLALSIAIPVVLHGHNNALLDLGMVFSSIVEDIIVFVIGMIIWKKAMKNYFLARYVNSTVVAANMEQFGTMV